MRLERAPQRRRLIGLTPLVDVVFILLVFFMLASTLEARQGLAVAAAGGAGGAGGEGAILVRIAGDGAVDLAGRPLALADLEAALATRLAAEPAAPVLVLAADDVALARLVAVMDAVAAAGAPAISVGGGPGR